MIDWLLHKWLWDLIGLAIGIPLAILVYRFFPRQASRFVRWLRGPE